MADYIDQLPQREPFLLAQQVNFEPGRLAGKILAQTDSFTLILYAIMAGDILVPAPTGSICLALALRGKVKAKISGRCYEVADGQSIIIPPEATHSFTAIVSCKLLLILML